MPSVRCCVLIPVYNHGRTLREVTASALQFTDSVLVVDDGSTDGGPATLQGLPVTLISLPQNRGKGAAILRGAEEARRLGYTHVIVMDADGQHKAQDLPVFFAAVEEDPCALIIGARNFNVPGVPGSSRFGRKFSGFWMFLQTGVPVSDMQSGFRAYPLQMLQAVRCSETRYSFEVEIAVRSAWAGFAIKEIPVSVYYPPRGERVSHFRAVADNIRISLLNTRLTVRALMPVPFRRQALEVEGLSLLRPGHAFRTLCAAASPRQLAASTAWSLFLSTLPLPGLQTLLLLFTIGRRRLNRLCALLMVPLTWPPFVPGLAVLLGYRIIHGAWLTEFTIQTLGYEAGYRFLDWMAGSLFLAPLLASVGGALVFAAASCFALLRRPGAERRDTSCGPAKV